MGCPPIGKSVPPRGAFRISGAVNGRGTKEAVSNEAVIAA